MIDWLAQKLAVAGVKSTWFVTHDGEAIGHLRLRPDLFELGIHPNFLPGSTHGSDQREVLAHMFSIVPGARTMRTHSVYQSGPLLEYIATHTSVRLDSSILLPGHPGLAPVVHYLNGKQLVRLPFFWSDDHELGSPAPKWDLNAYAGVPGYKVMAFHPVHVYLNSSSNAGYLRMKRSGRPLGKMRQDEVDPFVNQGSGARTVFIQLIEYLGMKKNSRNLCDILDESRSR